jgi:hydrogenase expression/formation protein HypC
MCLAVPMRIREIREDGMGLGDLDGAEHQVDLSLVAAPRAGDYVIVHAGYAIEKLDRKEADERLTLFRELAATWPAAATP